jgi:hypothetical protein
MAIEQLVLFFKNNNKASCAEDGKKASCLLVQMFLIQIHVLQVLYDIQQGRGKKEVAFVGFMQSQVSACPCHLPLWIHLVFWTRLIVLLGGICVCWLKRSAGEKQQMHKSFTSGR